MEILPLQAEDIPGLRHFQPPDWSDVMPALRYYVDSEFCHPVKAVIGNKIVGVGTSIIHHQVAWLATIITHPDHRNKGIGTIVTSALIARLENTTPSIMLVATPLGEFVYKKLGFATDGEYLFFKDGLPSEGKTISPNIFPYEPDFKRRILELDFEAAGEDRAMRLEEYLADGKVYVRQGHVSGFYLPSFGEGLIVAENAEAGTVLLHAKHISSSVTILPKENIEGINFLKERGYLQYRTAARMRLGKKLDWNPEMIYSRVSGAIG
jgi:GNAT superfamily N-acetyltransferase